MVGIQHYVHICDRSPYETDGRHTTQHIYIYIYIYIYVIDRLKRLVVGIQHDIYIYIYIYIYICNRSPYEIYGRRTTLHTYL